MIPIPGTLKYNPGDVYSYAINTYWISKITRQTAPKNMAELVDEKIPLGMGEAKQEGIF